VKLICGNVGEAKWFPPFHDGQCRYGRIGVSAYRISRRKLKAAILESTAVKARKVWWPGRKLPKTGSITGIAGKWDGGDQTGG